MKPETQPKSCGIKETLRMEVAPSPGCAEPSAIGPAAAAATSLLPDRKFQTMEIWVDPNVYKNAFAVSIPGAGGGSGMDLAAAVGALGGGIQLRNWKSWSPLPDRIFKGQRLSCNRVRFMTISWRTAQDFTSVR